MTKHYFVETFTDFFYNARSDLENGKRSISGAQFKQLIISGLKELYGEVST